MVKLPPVKKLKYNEQMVGVAGEIGSGRYGVRYLQTAIPIKEIERLTLVTELPDSERWHVRQLFQRDIDMVRVLSEIMPYFKNPQKIKFFNPLTIVLMPMDAQGRVLMGVKEVKVDAGDAAGFDGEVWEADGHYKLSWPNIENPFGLVDYNSNHVKLVAVDGQHRLQALKRLAREQMANPSDANFEKVKFDAWRIPIVLLVFPPTDKLVGKQHVLLENVRDIFVTINTNAQRPNRCREILLNDYSATAICCQELLDHCHQANSDVPLLFFDWRAHDRSEDNFYPENPQAFLRVEELEDYHIKYLMGEGTKAQVLTQEQRDALFIDDITIEEADEDGRAKLREHVRQRYRETLLPGVIHIFKTFKPFADYVSFLNELRASCDTDIKVHAMSVLLYGVHHAAENLVQAIEQEVSSRKQQCETKKKQLPVLFTNVIGGRGIFCGFSLAKPSRDEALKSTSSWIDAAQWYAECMNGALKNGYFDFDNKLLRHVAIDHNGHIVNYRLDYQGGALGTYCALIACSMSKPKAKFLEAISKHINELDDTIYRGYKKELRPILKDANPGIDRIVLNKQVEKKAREKTNTQIKALKAELDIENS